MRRLPIYLLLDTSGSMRGEPIESVNQGIQMLVSILRRDPNALEMAFLSIITFDDHARQVLPLTELLEFQCPALTVDQGLTSLGAGLELLAERIEGEVVRSGPQTRGDWRPLVFIMTDGEPTDDWEAGLRRLQRVKTGTVVACAAGPNTDTHILKQITPNVVEIEKAERETLQAFFTWVSASVSSVSQAVEAEPGKDRGLDDLPPLPPKVKLAGKLRKSSDTEDARSPFNNTRAQRAANMDKYGNPDGSQFDLAKDGAFKGMQVAVLHLYTGENFDFRLPTAALAEKGFEVHRWSDHPPSTQEMARQLEHSCQLWIISDQFPKLTSEHLTLVKKFFDAGHGVYVWGDNDPFYADANSVAHLLFGGNLNGNLQGEQVVTRQNRPGSPGMVPTHPVCTGLERLYEGHTIATISAKSELVPVVLGSEGNLVVAAFDRNGRRALLDGGFTRLYVNWDTAGTGRYVKNAAAWLVNYERFGVTRAGK